MQSRRVELYIDTKTSQENTVLQQRHATEKQALKIRFLSSPSDRRAKPGFSQDREGRMQVHKVYFVHHQMS